MKKFFALMLCVSLAGCATAPTATTTESVAPATLTDAQAAPAADTAAVPAPEAAAAPEVAVATAAAAGAAPAAEAAPTAGQVVGDVAAQCAKKYAALKACDQTGFGAGICRKVVEKKYSSLACALVR